MIQNNMNNKYDIGPYIPIAKRQANNNAINYTLTHKKPPSKNNQSKNVNTYTIDFDHMKTEIKNNAAFEMIGSQGPLSGIMMG